MRYCLRFRSGGLATAVFIFYLLSARAGGDRLGDDADVIDARHAKRIDHGCKTAKRNGFIATEEDALLRVFQLRADLGAELVNVGGLIAEVDALGLVHGDDEALLIDFLDGASLGDVDLDARLENG